MLAREPLFADSNSLVSHSEAGLQSRPQARSEQTSSPSFDPLALVTSGGQIEALLQS